VLESTGVICAFGVPSSAPETARRALAGWLSLSYVPDEFVADELLLLLEELATGASELESARRSLGRSSSLLDDELDDELLLDDELAITSSESVARRSLGRLVPLLLEELFDELAGALGDSFDPEVLIPKGRDVSSVATEAAECSSGVPSFTIAILTA
jgi:hypothetical protein